MPGSNRANKGNPASHRMSAGKKKARCARNWAEQQKRKAARKAKQAEAEARNRDTVANDGLTPWQRAKAARAAKRNETRKAA